jgi:hypothetical protein
MAKEQPLVKAILSTCQRPHIRLFRNNTGAVFPVGVGGKTRCVRYGLAPGSADIIGWKSVEIRIAGAVWAYCQAVFVAIECKSQTALKPRNPKSKSGKKALAHWIAQEKFLQDVRDAGGIAGIVRTAEEAMQLLGI